MLYEIKIITTQEKTETLLLSLQQKENLERELRGEKLFIEEYKTTKGKILTDLEIQRLSH